MRELNLGELYEPEIGEIVRVNGVEGKCVEGKACRDCLCRPSYNREYMVCGCTTCMSYQRKDDKGIIIEKI